MAPFQFTNTELPDVVELRKVKKTYADGKVVVLDDCDLLLEHKPDEGSIVGLMGPSGCGKSTILQLIAGLLKPSSGEVFLNGVAITTDMPISMVFQSTALLDHYSVLFNVMLPLTNRGMANKEAEERAKEMLDAVGLKDHIYKYARKPELSGGQIRRAEIAQALIANPNILLLDEPNTGLDVQTKYRIQLLLQNIWKQLKCTIMMVEHIPDESVFLCDTIYIMRAKPGQIVKKITIDLPYPRTSETLRLKRYFELVQEVKAALMELESPDV